MYLHSLLQQRLSPSWRRDSLLAPVWRQKWPLERRSLGAWCCPSKGWRQHKAEMLDLAWKVKTARHYFRLGLFGFRCHEQQVFCWQCVRDSSRSVWGKTSDHGAGPSWLQHPTAWMAPGFLSQPQLPHPHQNWVNPILTSIFCQIPPKPMPSPVVAGKQLWCLIMLVLLL